MGETFSSVSDPTENRDAWIPLGSGVGAMCNAGSDPIYSSSTVRKSRENYESRYSSSTVRQTRENYELWVKSMQTHLDQFQHFLITHNDMLAEIKEHIVFEKTYANNPHVDTGDLEHPITEITPASTPASNNGLQI